MKTWNKDVGLIARGLGEIHRICRGLLALTLLQAVFAALSPFVNIYMSARIVGGIEEGAGLRLLLLYAAVTVALNLLVQVLRSILSHACSSWRYRFWQQCEMRISDKMMLMDYVDVESSAIHRLRQRIEDFRTIDGSGLGNLLEQFQMLAGNGFTILFSVSMVAQMFTASFGGEAEGVLALAVSPAAAVILVLVILLNACISMRFGEKMIRKVHITMNEATTSNRIYNYYLTNHIATYHTGKDIRIYNQKGLLREEAMEQLGVARKVFGKLFWNEAKYSGASSGITVVASTLVYLFVGLRALAGMINIGAVVRYIGGITQFTEGFTGFVSAISKIRTNNDAIKAYFEFMDIPNHKYMGKRAVLPKGDYHEVEFRDVSFRYPDMESWALRHVSLTFKVSNRMAVVGMNGSGKTTFIKLLCRLYDPTEGVILLDGVDIREYDIEAYQELFSVVFQDFKLFAFTLGENVACGAGYDSRKVETCLTRAGFGDRYSKMTKGTETCLYKDFKQDGVEVSGGEAQKIALARALYKDAPFVILDEPTAALDPIAEYEIYSRFNEIVGGKTAIYISHRLSSCKFCDDIAVFHMGELVQRGTHDELVACEEGKYYELWNAQAQYYK